ncbi:hypothetical protein K7W42_22160, partial [Deinococcus sp. HMF7604]|uniref:hypothetical protein n=1 Tax=Deinococcus betulae TaxID=2873312 RepID=UPI001CCD5042
VLSFLAWREEIRTAPADVAALSYVGIVYPAGYGLLTLLCVGGIALVVILTRVREDDEVEE